MSANHVQSGRSFRVESTVWVCVRTMIVFSESVQSSQRCLKKKGRRKHNMPLKYKSEFLYIWVSPRENDKMVYSFSHIASMLGAEFKVKRLWKPIMAFSRSTIT